MDSTSSFSKLQSTLGSADSAFNPADALGQNTALSTAAPSLLAPRASLLFIDSAVADYQSLVAGAAAGTEVYLLNSAQDAVSQITNTLLGREGISSIHIVSHGQSGGLNFANGLFNLSSLPEYATQIQSWSQALTDDADILLYGCNVAEGELGQAFVQILSQLTGADIAASNDLTGNSALGGNWNLEVTTGKIDTSIALQTGTTANYASTFAPVLTVSGTTNYPTSGSPTVLASGLTINDTAGATLDGARVTLTTNFNSSQDRLGVQGQSGTSGTISGLSWSYNSTNGVLTLTGNALVTTYQSVLRQVTYSNISGSPSPSSRGVQFSLGSSLANPTNGHFYEFVTASAIDWVSARSAAASRSLFGLQGYLVTVTSASEQAFVQTKLNGQGWMGANDAVTEGNWRWVTGPEGLANGGTGTQFWSGLGVGGSSVGGQYNNWAAGEPNDASSVGGEDYAHFLLGGTWNDYPLSLSDISGYVVEYGGMPGDPTLQITGNVSVNITPPNAAPSVSLPSGAITYTENAVATVLDTSATISDSDSANFDTGTLTVSFSANGTVDDRLIINNQGTGAGQIGVSGSNITYGGTTVGTFTGGVGTTPLVITFNANSSPAAAQALLRNLGYSNVSDTPSTTARTISVVLTDGDGGTSSTVTKTVNVTAVDDPSVLNISGNLNFTEDSPAIVVAPALTISDPDGMNGARVSIANPGVGDALGIQGQSGTSGTISGINWSYDNTTGILTFSGAASAATYQSVLRQVTYSNSSQAPTPGDRNIQFSLGSVLSNPGNNHFYEFVSAPNISWTAAQTAAANRRLFGLQGYLATITSASEQAFVESKLNGQGWMGASDAATEGDWRWVTGPEGLANGGTGTPFWSGLGIGGAPVGGQYNNWDAGEPNNAGNEDYAHFLDDGQWNDYPLSLSSITGYVVEYGGMPGDPSLQTTGNVTITVAAVNDPSTGNITIPTTVQEGQQVTANTSGFSDPDGIVSFSYQWQQSTDGVNWTNITGATNVNFTPGDAQVGQRLRVQVSYTDGGGTAEGPILSNATTSGVVNVNNSPTGNVVISGTVQEDQQLTADTSGLSDADGLGAFNYQWQQSTDGVNWTNITGAINVNFTPGDAQVGQRLRVQVSYTDGDGTSEGPISSTATASAVSNINDAPTGSISITGTVQENQTLTADTSGLSDGDGLGAFSYQWQQSTDGVNWTNVTGATNVNFTPGDAQVGQRLRVQVSYTDGQGTAEGPISSTATATAVTNVNDAPTGSISITGTVQENQTLTADTSGFSDGDGLGAFSYQWQQSTDGVNWTNVTGATNVNFTPGDAQVGQRLRVQVSYTDGQGTAEGPISSTATATAVTNVNDAPTGTIAITGTVQENQTLTADTSGLSDADGLGAFSYQWQQSSDGVNWTNVTGATNVNFTPGDAQVGQRLRVQVSYTDGQGTTEGPLSSTATATAVTNVNDVPTGTISITGTVQENQTLTANTSGLSDGDGLGTFNYQWQQSSDGVNWTNVTGATNVNFTPGDAQVGQRLRVQVSYTDGQGTTEGPLSSTATATAVSNVNDVPTGTISITGTVQENQTLTANTSGLSDGDGLGTFNYQWQQSSDGVNWTNVTGATNVNFTPGDAQVGQRLRVQVSYTDGQGTTEGPLSSTATATAVSNVNDVPTGTISITGTAQENQTLTANTSGLSDGDGLGSFNYQWQQSSDGVNWTNVTGATNVNFTPDDAQVGKQLRAQISYTDGQGTAESVFSDPTASITGVNDAPTLNGPTSINVTENTPTAITGIIFSDVDAGTGTLTATFTIPAGTLAAISGNGVTVGGTATNLTLSGTLANINAFITAGSLKYTTATNSLTAQTLNVTINDNGTGGIGGSLTANTTINLPVTPQPPAVSISNVSHSEGTRGNKTYTFTVALSKASNQTITINYATADGTAKVSDNDYVVANGTLTFNPGDPLTKTFTVTVNGDSKLEATENFQINLSLVSGTATIANTTALGIIGDDDGNGLDINLDGTVDSFWRNESAGVSGIWFMNGTSLASTAALPSVNSDWRMEETGDFNDDGIDDFFWHNTATGQTGIWLMNQTGGIASIVSSLTVSADWRLEEVGDFNGDNKVDMLWRNASTGDNGIWLMNGTTYSTSVALLKADSSWEIAAVGDFDGDKNLDILWRNTVTGANGIWHLNNTSFSSATALATATPGWTVADVADLDADGDLDILWHNTTTADVGIWKMNNSSVAPGGYLALPRLMSDPGWRIRGIIDVEGDGKLEIFWRHLTLGANGIWRMDGVNYSGNAAVPAADPSWSTYIEG